MIDEWQSSSKIGFMQKNHMLFVVNI